jgi:peptidoglycan/xylan/chitin deacetylase (PgdA/CDA1 family)
LTLVNFTPGTLSNADYTVPGGDGRYVPSDTIFQRVLSYEAGAPGGLKGFLLLTHIGTDPRRVDKFYDRLDRLVTVLKGRGYEFRRLGG